MRVTKWGSAVAGLVLCASSALWADTLGNVHAGTNPRVVNGQYRCNSGVLPANVDAGAYSVFFRIEDAATGDSFRAVLFAADGSTVIAYSAVRTDISTLGAYEFTGGTFASVALTASTDLRICVGSNSAAGANAYFSDTPTGGAGGYGGTVNSVTANPPTITGSLVSEPTRPYSGYLNYTPASGGGSHSRRRLMGVGR